MQSSITKNVLITIAATLVTCAAPLALQCDELKTTNLEINSPKPLNEALDKVQQDLHLAINYEEAPIKSSKFLVRGRDIGMAPDLLFPRTQTLRISFVEHESSPYSAVQTILAAYEGAGLPGAYRVRQDLNSVDVIPLEAQPSAADSVPLFERAVTVAGKMRTFAETVQSIADQMSAVSGVRVVVLTHPFTMKNDIWFSANQEPALAALKRLNEDKGDISFRLIYDPSDGTYCLNLAGVPPRAEKPTPSLAKPAQQPQNPFFVKTR